MAFLEKIIKFFQDWFNKMTAEGKRRFALICTAAFAVILSFSVIFPLVNSEGGKKPDEPEKIKINIPIPAEELFLPDEPDFIPGVLLERERRSSWTEHDAEEFWQDPLKYGEEQWREKIEAAIDEFLERVP
ncbi:MAG: hypothetical protein FWF68_08585 [Spirochaetes bacterium]|nr:hypothetical protein [Brevinematales bacterium]MCL1959641.1 hypothetical protein [Spirochaetota bacterium]